MKNRHKPIIRPGQRNPYRKGTKAQIAERIGYCVQLVALGLTKTQIVRAVRNHYGVQYRQIFRYLDLVYTGKKPVSKWHARLVDFVPVEAPYNPQLDELQRMSKLVYPQADIDFFNNND